MNLVLPEGLFATTYHFVKLISDLAGSDDPGLLLGAAAASEATLNQNACVDLAAWAEHPVSPETELLYPPLAEWQAALRAHPLVVGQAGDYLPLILVGPRLYLQRYWQYEARLAQTLMQRGNAAISADLQRLVPRFAQLFPASPLGATSPANVGEGGGAGQALDWQAVAAANVLLNPLTVIAGGPGTGKTTTVSRILALLLEQTPDLKIALAAPTGKAAARMKQSLDLNLPGLNLPPELQAQWPQSALTLHRLLGTIPHSHRFVHHAGHPLPWDVVIVDEASMIDLAMMSKLLDAIRPDARLVLLGDRDQLASVEAGCVLGDICRAAPATSFTPERITALAPLLGALQLSPSSGPFHSSLEPFHSSLEPFHNCVIELQLSRRFGPQSGIGHLARAVNAGQAEQAVALLKDSTYPDISLAPLPLALEQGCLARLPDYAPYLQAPSPEVAFAALESQIILAALRQGVENVNRAMEQALLQSGALPTYQLWYHLRPVLISENDYLHELYNGDLGLTWNPDGQNPRVWFRHAEGHLRSFSPAQLKAHQTAWALTVHKSQGSEFNRVLLVLPPEPHPLLSRELIYTGLTRARERVEIWGDVAVLRAGILRKIQRSSGLVGQLQSGERK
ncbi:MAG: exodeoxyribonuclease V subunit alpha [Candidatus Sericytochromatia bacterium]|nr:exodeoxyribonuclease V subunit alpha [Candidatus Sericytochromatia bacterium]